MVQKVAPSLQHYIRGYYETPEMVCQERLKFLMSPPQMTYKPLFGVFEDMLRNHPYNELLTGIAKADKRDWVVDNYKEILKLLNGEFAGISTDYIHCVERSYYNVGRDILVPFEPPLIYGIKGQKFMPWLSFWRSSPLSDKKLSLFATLVEELLRDNPDWEDITFNIYDLSATRPKDDRGLIITDLKDIPKVSHKEKVSMLETLEAGYAMAEQRYVRPRRIQKEQEVFDPNQGLLNF